MKGKAAALLLCSALVSGPAGAQAGSGGRREPLVIQEQGSFAIGVPMAEFRKLISIPIVVCYGDFTPDKPSDYPARTDGACGWKWPGGGAMPSTVTGAT